MKVRINTGAQFEWTTGNKIPEFEFRGNVVLATDPGKTNMAIVIGTAFGEPLTVLQFSAPGYQYDNSQYCHDFKSFLTGYLKDCTVVTFAIEAAISKQGMNYHRSSFVLTEIRANLIDLSYQLTGKAAFEVNNWSWKYAILPDGMRGQNYKGSAIFLQDVYNQYGNADVTDSLCIYMYTIKKTCNISSVIPSMQAAENHVQNYKILITRGSFMLRDKARAFIYNPQFSLQENMDYAANRTGGVFYAIVNPEWLTLDEIYDHTGGIGSFTDAEEVAVFGLRS